MDQWDKTAQAIVQARYGYGPAATANAIADALRTISKEGIKAGTEVAVMMAASERAACANLAREMAAKGWGTAPLNALADAIEARGRINPTPGNTGQLPQLKGAIP